MFESILVPLMLAETLDEVKGRTRFQKLVFLIQKTAETENLKERFDLNFEMYLYGPYSQELSLMIDDLVRSDYLKEKIAQTASNYEMHTFRLTNKGEDALADAKAKKLISLKMLEIIGKIGQGYGNLPLKELVAEAYRQF
jgi:hypothetical protein